MKEKAFMARAKDDALGCFFFVEVCCRGFPAFRKLALRKELSGRAYKTEIRTGRSGREVVILNTAPQ